jgi:hypothetical protein
MMWWFAALLLLLCSLALDIIVKSTNAPAAPAPALEPSASNLARLNPAIGDPPGVRTSSST